MYYILSTLIMGTCNVVKIVKIALFVHLLMQLVLPTYPYVVVVSSHLSITTSLYVYLRYWLRPGVMEINSNI